METNKQQRIGKTAFTEYSTWDEGQHFMLIQYMIPHQPRIPLGYVYLQLDEQRKATYLIKDKEGNEVIPPAKSMVDVKKHFKQHGWEMAQKILEKRKSQGKDSITQTSSEDEGEEGQENNEERSEEVKSARKSGSSKERGPDRD